jgi:hypothetical protein
MPTTLIKDRTAIVSIGQAAFGKGLEDSELSRACQAISMAIDDAGATGPCGGMFPSTRRCPATRRRISIASRSD